MATNILNVQIVTPGAKVLGKRSARDNELTMDLSKPLPYPTSEEVVEAMRQRILQLETELHAAKKQKTVAAKAAKQTTLNAAAGSSAAIAMPAPANRDMKAEAKTLKTRTKSLFDQMKKAAKAEKYTDVVRTVRVEEHFSQADFELVFCSSGTLVQPTPTNKPTSNVWIKSYVGEDAFAALFGENYKLDQLKGTRWSKGDIFVGKGQKIGPCQLEIQSIDVTWSKNTGKAVLKIEITQENFLQPESYW